MPTNTIEIYHKKWTVERTAIIDEIKEEEGEIRWRVEVWDGERAPFLTRYFSTKEAAHHFIDRVRKTVEDAGMR